MSVDSNMFNSKPCNPDNKGITPAVNFVETAQGTGVLLDLARDRGQICSETCEIANIERATVYGLVCTCGSQNDEQVSENKGTCVVGWKPRSQSSLYSY